MGLEKASLTASEMFRLSCRVPRWFNDSDSNRAVLHGDIRGVSVRVLHFHYGSGIVTGDRYDISACFEDTDLGKHSYRLENLGGRPQKPEGEPLVKDAFTKAWAAYIDNREKFQREDVRYAKGLVPRYAR